MVAQNRIGHEFTRIRLSTDQIIPVSTTTVELKRPCRTESCVINAHVLAKETLFLKTVA